MDMGNVAANARRARFFVVGTPASVAIANLVARGRDHDDAVEAVCWLAEGYSQASGAVPDDALRFLALTELPEGLDIETLTESSDDLLTENIIPVGDEDIATAAFNEGKSLYLVRLSPPPRF